jgi:hypothetical protein
MAELDRAVDVFACPCHRRVHVSAFQYPKTTDVSG